MLETSTWSSFSYHLTVQSHQWGLWWLCTKFWSERLRKQALVQVMHQHWPVIFRSTMANISPVLVVGYRNWPRYSLRWSGWYCNPAQHELCRPSRGRLHRAGHDSADRISGQFLFYHDHNFTNAREKLRFRRLVPLFVPIGVCVTTHDDGTASDVTIGLWRHNQQATNHERNGKPWFSLPK